MIAITKNCDRNLVLQLTGYISFAWNIWLTWAVSYCCPRSSGDNRRCVRSQMTVRCDVGCDLAIAAIWIARACIVAVLIKWFCAPVIHVHNYTCSMRLYQNGFRSQIKNSNLKWSIIIYLKHFVVYVVLHMQVMFHLEKFQFHFKKNLTFNLSSNLLHFYVGRWFVYEANYTVLNVIWWRSACKRKSTLCSL